MTPKKGIAAQISTFPMDLRHFEALLPHQIRQLGSNVERIVVTIDTHRSRSGRYHGDNFDEHLQKLRQVCVDARKSFPQLEISEVDYSAPMQREVSQYFFGTDSMPVKAWDGGYFYSLFFGLYQANAQYVFHYDGDMLFGGGSKTWVREAIECMSTRPDVYVVAPLPGPPRPDGKVFGHDPSAGGFAFRREEMPWLAYRHKYMSSRVLLMDMNKMKSRLGVIPWVPTTAKQKVKARLLGHPPEAIEAEILLSKALQSSDSYRIDELGSGPGFWSLHPPYRSEEFYRRLPEFIRRVEANDIPEAQLGHYDMHDSMIDWSQARANTRWYRRYKRMIGQRLNSLVQT